MNIFTDSKRKYLLLIPIVVLVFNAVYFQYATKEIKAAMLQEKFVEVKNELNMLAAAVEANPERIWLDYEKNIVDSVEFLDMLYQVYGAAYKLVDGEFSLITERYFETSIFEPLDFPEFIQSILTEESGSIVIGYAPERQNYRELHLYFRWMPIYSPQNERYLVIAGVSELSVVTEIPLLVSIGLWVSTAVTFLLNVWLIILLTRLGYIYDQRKDEKWRSGR